MPQGLCNAPATNQRRLNKILASHISVICFVYFEDVIIFGAETLDEHVRRVRIIMKTLLAAKFVCSPRKSVLISTKIEALGHFVSRHGLGPDPLKIAKIQAWPAPRTKKGIQEFMGLVNYCRKFVRRLSDYTPPLTNLTKKNVVFRWGEIQQNAFRQIKACLDDLPHLKGIDYNSGETIWVVTDASDTGIGGMLGQGPDWKTCAPIAFESRTYCGAEKNYHTHDKELLALV